jgi:L-galactono-1,4-lactone dehydrogenase
LGVVTEVTLQCVPAHKLVERTFVTSVKDVKRNHTKWLQTHKHLRYMWLPATDSVVVVQCNEEGSAMAEATVRDNAAACVKRGDVTHTSNPLRELVKSTKGMELGGQDPDDLSPTECRDVLLAHDPLNPSWVESINRAEAAFWKSNEGIRVGYSDEILGFDCGGQQWVFEVAFPCGTRDHPNGWDISYMEELLKLIKRNKIPAPSPIEQRWTSGSSSSMSPCSGTPESLHSWVGIIMYLPEEAGKEELRDAVTREFIGKYRRMVEQRLLPRYRAVEHWAKLEIPADPKDLQATRARLHARYPIEAFQQARAELDPDNILGGDAVDAFFA